MKKIYTLIIIGLFALTCSNIDIQPKFSSNTEVQSRSIETDTLEQWTYSQVFNYQSVCWYVFDPVQNNLNCSLKFLYDCDSLSSADTLVIGAEPEVGTAFYVLDSINVVGPTEHIYHFLQGRETYNGVYNNNGICNIYNQFASFTVQLNSPSDSLFELGDTVYINHLSPILGEVQQSELMAPTHN